MQEYPDAANEIKAWVAIVEGVRWHNFAEVRLMFWDADYINGYVIFNIRRNRYGLITVIHYAKTTSLVAGNTMNTLRTSSGSRNDSMQPCESRAARYASEPYDSRRF
jgi:mRNA-degrading endonuclease HigB of HigAB toxin-antitoxin module